MFFTDECSNSFFGANMPGSSTLPDDGKCPTNRAAGRVALLSQARGRSGEPVVVVEDDCREAAGELSQTDLFAFQSAHVRNRSILTAVSGILWLLGALIQRTVPFAALRLGAIGSLALASIALFAVFRCAAHTSIDHQGEENLVASLKRVPTSLPLSQALTTIGRRRHSWPVRSN